jgi:hypothetical protein
MDDFPMTDVELQLVIKSIAITCDAALNKRNRSRGENPRRFREATQEYLDSDALLTKLRAELRLRIMADPST